MACSEYQHFYKLLGQIIFRIICSQRHNSLVFAATQIANNLSPIMGCRLEKYYLFCNNAFLSLFTIKFVQYIDVRQNTL